MGKFPPLPEPIRLQDLLNSAHSLTLFIKGGDMSVAWDLQATRDWLKAGPCTLTGNGRKKIIIVFLFKNLFRRVERGRIHLFKNRMLLNLTKKIIVHPK